MLRWVILFVGAAIVTYLLLATPHGRPNRNTQIFIERTVAENAR